MQDDEQFEAMAEACLKAHESVTAGGTPVMIAITRALLWQVGQELAQREARREEMLRHSEAAYSEPSKFPVTQSSCSEAMRSQS